MRAAALLPLICLAGCAALPPAAPPAGLAQRQAELSAIDNWQLRGRVAVAVDGEGTSASVDWRQSGAVSEISLSGPFGAGALAVSLDAGSLAVEDGSGARLQGADAESLLADRLGARVPLAALRYWVLGIPSPTEPYRVLEGSQAFEQYGWSVLAELSEATPAGMLPGRLTILRGTTRLRLAVSRWELGR